MLLALSLINENILLFYRLPEADGDGWGFNLLWWLAMASTLLAVSRSRGSTSCQPAMGICAVVSRARRGGCT